MEQKPILSERLKAVAAFVEQGASVADIGTDHGFLPVWLVKSGVCTQAVAADVRPGPLASAVRTAQAWGVSEQIRFILSDGLDQIDPQCVDTVVMAGMGGETMMTILDRASWTLQQGTHLILQPQSKLDSLANWLDCAGYAIGDACLVRDAGRIYVVLSVRRGASRAPFSCAQMYADRILMEKRDPLLPDYLELLIRRARKVIRGLEQAAAPDVLELTRQRLALEGFLKMKEETNTWCR